MPQLTLQCAATCGPVGLPFSWQLTWQDPLPLRNHDKDVGRQVLMEPSPTASFSIAGFVWGFLLLPAEQGKIQVLVISILFIHSKFIRNKKLTNI